MISKEEISRDICDECSIGVRAEDIILNGNSWTFKDDEVDIIFKEYILDYFMRGECIDPEKEIYEYSGNLYVNGNTYYVFISSNYHGSLNKSDYSCYTYKGNTKELDFEKLYSMFCEYIFDHEFCFTENYKPSKQYFKELLDEEVSHIRER